MNKTIKLCFFLLVACSFQSIYAQLEAHYIDFEGWARGNYIEFGINARGVYGAETANRPPGFHLNRESDGNGIFGFIANPLADGWVDYDGDYFTPGSPEEGFAIEINGTNYNNNNANGLFEIPGEVTGVNVISSDCFEDIAQISWEGNIEGLNIKRYYSITKEGLFIQMTTTIKNLSGEVKSDVFWMHNVDPDNNVTLSGNYSTDMALISQASGPGDDVCLVKASQDALGTPEDMDGSHVSLYAKDENARVSYGGFDNRDASNVWTGLGFTNTEGSTTNNIDEAISLAFSFGDIAAGETVQFTYYYILEDVDEDFIPFIVNAIQENPTTCFGNDGEIIFYGLTAGETYNISFEVDGIFIPETPYVADINGEVHLNNLWAATYDNITISFGGCVTDVDTVFVLTDPEPPNFTISGVDLTDCDALNGMLVFSGLTPSTSYSITYTYEGTVVGPQDFSADDMGDVTITGLGVGQYTDFVVTQYDCTTTSNEIIELNGTFPLTITPQDPISCGGSDGAIVISNLTSGATYVVSYEDNGTLIPDANYTADASGEFEIINLNAGSYTNFTLTYNDCVAINNSIITLSDPGAPTYTVSGVDITDCEALDGMLIFSGLIPSTNYSITYSYDGTVIGPQNLTSDASGDITITGLGVGQYTDFIVDLNDCITTNNDIIDISGTFTANFTPVDPISCDGSDGYILISNLSAGDIYSISYEDDGVLIPSTDFTADASGEIQILNLNAGTYSDFILVFNDCIANLSGVYVLTDPPAPNYSVTGVDITDCELLDGMLIFSGLTATGSYTLTYSYDGTVIGPTNYIADAGGEIIITGLGVGQYTDFIIQQNSCTTTNASIIDLIGTFNFSVTPENPITCDGSNGYIVLGGLSAGGIYTVNYLDDGILVPDTNYTASADGEIQLVNLNAGAYSNFILNFNGCVGDDLSVYTLSDPEPPNYTVSSEDFTNCGSIDGILMFSGLTPSSSYTVEYTHDGVLIGPQELTTDVNGDIILNGLSGGSYTDFVIEQFDCVTTSNDVAEIFGPLSPTAYPIPDQFYCDEDFDYITDIDLTLLDDFVIGPDLTGTYDITYHASAEDADNSVNLNASNYTTTGVATYVLFAKKTEVISGCYSYIPFNITIHLPSNFEILDDFLCLNSDDTINDDYELPVLDTELDDSTHNFEWYLDGVLLSGETQSSITVSDHGTYSVTATVIATGCDYTDDAVITPSGPPQNFEVIMVTPHFSDNHTVEIVATGYGDYVYAANNGPWQESPIFYNLPYGLNVFQIIDTNGCGIVTVEKMLIDYMQFFTPNDDGIKDYWQIIGVEDLVQAEIYIFDRHGKLLKQLSPTSKGWDGTFNNYPMPSNDYWFRLTFRDQNDNPHEFMEHFALKR